MPPIYADDNNKVREMRKSIVNHTPTAVCDDEIIVLSLMCRLNRLHNISIPWLIRFNFVIIS